MAGHSYPLAVDLTLGALLEVEFDLRERLMLEELIEDRERERDRADYDNRRDQ